MSDAIFVPELYKRLEDASTLEELKVVLKEIMEAIDYNELAK